MEQICLANYLETVLRFGLQQAETMALDPSRRMKFKKSDNNEECKQNKICSMTCLGRRLMQIGKPCSGSSLLQNLLMVIENFDQLDGKIKEILYIVASCTSRLVPSLLRPLPRPPYAPLDGFILADV
eukprot:TRINITY_DN3103_c0_g1_i1.p1 TRINITY_DN3103_c0_g1~~TRINITY_DN3103_c0_g1_i1.p1  ORF type:complete len:127 (+),score=9.70 TRINITY_DN3103_c0_g1_i1:91-471(+)